MKEINTSKGHLKYRSPSISECFDIISCLTDDGGSPRGPLQAKKEIIKIAVPLIDHEAMGYKSAQDMVNDAEEMLLPVSELADYLYTFVVGKFNKKKE
jgi:hypothetical protein